MSETVLTFDTNKDSLKTEKLLPVYSGTNPLLAERMPAFDFSQPPFNPQAFADDLLFTMRHYHGLGLAANQVGIRSRVFVLESGMVCFNPRVVSVSEGCVHDREGCISFPGLWLRVNRPERIVAEYYDATGKVHQTEFVGMTARCFQHELDHLNGLVFTQHVGALTLQMAKKKQRKLFKKIERIQEFKTQSRNI